LNWLAGNAAVTAMPLADLQMTRLCCESAPLAPLREAA
jgi:hypothetical protein